MIEQEFHAIPHVDPEIFRFSLQGSAERAVRTNGFHIEKDCLRLMVSDELMPDGSRELEILYGLGHSDLQARLF